MSHEHRIDSVTAQEILLERKNDRSLRDDLREFWNAPFAPRPYLWRHVIQHRDPSLGGGGGDLHVESGIVDHDEQLDVVVLESAPYRVEKRDVTRDVTDDLQKSHHACLVPVEKLHSRCLHQRPPEPDELEIGAQKPQLFCDARRMEIARSFSRDEDDLSHGELVLLLSAMEACARSRRRS